MKRILIALSVLIVSSFQAKADEGMWLPINIGKMIHSDMVKMGLQLTPEQIYSVNQSSLKDAIVSLGGFCTGEIVSPEGLMLTNYHCTEGVLQSHSTVDNDLLTDGFWARSKDDELPNEGLYARFLVRMEDVTPQVRKATAKIKDSNQEQKVIDSLVQVIVDDATSESHYEGEVKPFFEGNEYYLLVYETYYDVRLVGAPPSSIGFFGGETDNWTWPRHTGDFSLFRVYSGPDGKPAPYSPENIPLKPRHFLPVSLSGIQEGDFSMVLGFPGSTDRYLTSFGIENALEFNPLSAKLMQKRQGILKKAMDENDETRIKYSSKFFTISNYQKYLVGQDQGLKNLNVLGRKQEQEQKFKDWVSRKKSRQEVYGDVLSEIENAYDSLNKYQKAYNYTRFSQYLVEVIPFSYSFTALKNYLERSPADTTTLKRLVNNFKSTAETYFKDYEQEVDQQVFTELMQMIANDLKPEMQPQVIQENSGNLSELADSIFSNSIFVSRDKVFNFLENPSAATIENDPAYQFAVSFVRRFQRISENVNEFQEKLTRYRKELIAGFRLMDADKDFYPDANSTLRLTYGQVKDYEPKDGVVYKYYTTLEGVKEKHQPGSEEFDAPEKLLELYEDRDFGIYGDQEMPLAFISNNDITGGNSGSPVVNGKGELIGIAFDGNWEAMSGDIAFEPDLQRCISVDIRYVLFVIDKFADARYLIDEMKLVNKPQKSEALN